MSTTRDCSLRICKSIDKLLHWFRRDSVRIWESQTSRFPSIYLRLLRCSLDTTLATSRSADWLVTSHGYPFPRNLKTTRPLCLLTGDSDLILVPLMVDEEIAKKADRLSFQDVLREQFVKEYPDCADFTYSIVEVLYDVNAWNLHVKFLRCSIWIELNRSVTSIDTVSLVWQF